MREPPQQLRQGFSLSPEQIAQLRNKQQMPPPEEKQEMKESVSFKTEDLTQAGGTLRAVDSTEATPDCTTMQLPELDIPEKEFSFWSSPVLWIFILILALGALQAYSLINQAFAQNTLSGIVWSSVIGIVFLFALLAIWQEIHAVLFLKSTDLQHKQVAHLITHGTYKEAVNLCKDMAQMSNSYKTITYARFTKMLQAHYTPADVFMLYEDIVLKKQDELVKNIIVRRSAENGIIVALSPLAWLDMALSLARSLRMIRQISEVYGLHCGWWGRTQLYRKVLHNLIFIGVADLATDAVTDVIGTGIASKMSAQVGKVVAAGIYSTRLGYMTMKVLRPLPFGTNTLTLATLRKELLASNAFKQILAQNNSK